MPYLETVCGNIRPEHGMSRGSEERSGGDGRKNADQEARRHEKRDGQYHPGRQRGRLSRQLGRRRAEERAENEAQRIGDAEHGRQRDRIRSEEHTSELQSLMRISYDVFCLKKKKIPRWNK